MDLKASLSFLDKLSKNNEREWFHGNKELYNEAKLEFETFINILIPLVKEIDPEVDVFHAKECLFRIFRDVRFAKDKSPYKTNFGAFIARGGRKSQFGGYYVHLEPGNSFVGGGAYMPQAPYLKAIRKEIFEHTIEYQGIINKPAFKKTFPEIYGEKLKTAPRDFPKDWPEIDLLRNKHYVVTRQVDDTFWSSGNIADSVTDILKVQAPFIHFINRAIARV
jgi:uncharacterized protein (TIGR02453 family)